MIGREQAFPAMDFMQVRFEKCAGIAGVNESGLGYRECLFRENCFGKVALGIGYEAVSVPILEHLALRLACP